MNEQDQGWQVAECLLPGLSRARAEAIGQRLGQVLAETPGRRVIYLGSLLMPTDEVLLCLFAGPEAEVRVVSEWAGVPFERILRCTGVGWRLAGGETADDVASDRTRPNAMPVQDGSNSDATR
ncbi:MAG TPA: hypothetical protein VGS19_04190 [Streptosporangiaceae bacterium]|nr:hypothetical protein [Streptosporangiaceae bacterium]